MKILIINNFNSENRIGGVEHYLHELIQYAEKNNSNFTFKWFGKDKIKTNWVEKFYHKTMALRTDQLGRLCVKRVEN